MDNLYNSAAFCRYTYFHRNWGQGIPDCVLQEEVKKKKAQIWVRGTVKAAKLVSDPGCLHFIASSVYDTRPVHYLSMVSDSIKWVEKERKVFLRLNQIDAYSNGMGHVDLADQLRGVYCLDRFVRNRKWWFLMIFFSTGVLLTNRLTIPIRA